MMRLRPYLILCLLLTSTARNWGIELSDDFSQDVLRDATRYVEFFDSGFSIEDGLLRATAEPGDRTLLNMLPALGREASFSVDVRWTGDGEGASFLILADWRYRRTSPWVDVAVSLDGNSISMAGQSASFEFQKDQWYTLRVDRAADELGVSVDGESLLQTTLPAKTGVIHVEEDGDIGGFGLMLEGNRPFAEAVEFDHLHLSGDAAARDYRAQITPFDLDSEEYLYSVIYEAGFETWASENAALAIPFLQAAADFYSTPPISTRLATVQSRGEYFDAGNGFNSLGIIEEQGLDQVPAILNCHELAHNWQHLYGKRWNVEGSANLACSAISEEQQNRIAFGSLFYLKPELREQFNTNDQGEIILVDEDRHLNFDGLPTSDSEKGYFKSSVFTFILYRILGPEAYRQLHREALELGHGMDSAEMQSIAEGLLGKDLGDVFAGWVFEGESRFPIAGIYDDSDNDGLGDLDELIAGLDPQLQDTDGDGHKDLSEMWAGYDPTDASSPASATILIDGLGDDWDEVSALAFTDEQGDSENDPDGGDDLRQVRVLGDATNGRLLVRVDYWQPFDPPDDADFLGWVSLDFAREGDGEYNDRRINFFYPLAITNVISRFYLAGEADEAGEVETIPPTGIEVAVGESFIEASVPTDMLWNESDFSFVVVAGISGVEPEPRDWLTGVVQVAIDDVTLPALPTEPWRPRPLERPDLVEEPDEVDDLPADFDGSGDVGFSDFFLFADSFGGTDSRFDLNGDGSVGFADFFILADSFGSRRTKLMALAQQYLGLEIFRLEQNQPNPFNSETTIRFALPQADRVDLSIYNLAGQKVVELVREHRVAGVYAVRWDGRDDDGRGLASGMYLYRLQAGERVETRKLMLVQ